MKYPTYLCQVCHTRHQETSKGHPIIVRGDDWVYADTQQPVKRGGERGCGFCGLADTPEGHDGCLGTLPGVMNACCGHGNQCSAYTQYTDGRIKRNQWLPSYLYFLEIFDDMFKMGDSYFLAVPSIISDSRDQEVVKQVKDTLSGFTPVVVMVKDGYKLSFESDKTILAALVAPAYVKVATLDPGETMEFFLRIKGAQVGEKT